MKKGFSIVQLIILAVIIGFLYNVALPKFKGVKTQAFGMQGAIEMERAFKDIADYYKMRQQFTTLKDMTFVRNFADVSITPEFDKPFIYGIRIKDSFQPCLEIIPTNKNGAKLTYRSLTGVSNDCKDLLERPDVKALQDYRLE